ncbi:MAG: hypothetical protein GXO79_06545 [Chlorobi bacterium]|nr:hypothetical protein [Chlorobiota bacterium]
MFDREFNNCHTLGKNNDIEKVYEVWRTHNHIKLKVAPLEFRKIIEQVATFFSAGSYYYYIFNFATLQMEYVHPTIKNVLGIDPEKFNIEKFLSIHHPDDLKVFNEKEALASQFLFNYISPKDIPYYKVVYVNRVKHSQGHYIKLLHQAKALQVTENGKIQHVLGVHTDISYLKTPVDHKVSFIGEGKPSYYSIDPINPIFNRLKNTNIYTSQELNIIHLISEGKSNLEIAEKLFISVNTVKTHRKNILQKSNANNSAHLIANCIREGII